MKAVFALSLSICCASCTTINIKNERGDVVVRRSFGFASIRISPDKGVVTAKVSSLGYISTPLGHSVGWTQQSITTTNDGCRVIIWIENYQDLDAIYDEVKNISSACALK